MINLLIQAVRIEDSDNVVIDFLLFHVIHEINVVAKGGGRRP